MNEDTTEARPATVPDFLRLADVMAQRLAEYLYTDDAPDDAAEAYAAARQDLQDALVSGVVPKESH